MKISLAEAPQSCFSLDPCRKINDVNVHQTMENHGMLLRYRLSTFKEKALKLSVISLTSQADVLRSLSHVPAPPMSAETSGYKRTLNIFSMLSLLVGILQKKGQRNATCMCENSSGNTEEFANEIGHVFADVQGYAHCFRKVTQGTTYEQTA